MARSLGLLAVVIAVLLFIGPARSLIFPADRDRFPRVDYTGYVTGFQDVTGVAAVVPQGLPASWRANVATAGPLGAGQRLHIGWGVPGQLFAGLDEATGSAAVLFRDVIGYAAPAHAGSTTVNGEQWQLGRSKRGEEVLARTVGKLTVIITGNATDEQLRFLAASLH